MMVVWSSKKEAEHGEIKVTIVSSVEVRNLDFILGVIESHVSVLSAGGIQPTLGSLQEAEDVGKGWGLNWKW